MPGLQLYLSLPVPRHKAPAKRAQRVHDAVGMVVWRCLVAGLIRVLKNSHSLVLEHDLVVLRIGDRGIQAHAMSMPASLDPREHMLLVWGRRRSTVHDQLGRESCWV